MKKHSISETTQIQELLTCPVCQKKFKPNEETTQYIIANGYPCSWKCFISDARRVAAEKKEQGKYKENKRSKNKTSIQFNFKT